MLWLARFIRASISNPYVLLARFYTRLIFLGHLQEQVIYRTLPQHTRQLLFVCKGNICRSPLAAAYFNGRVRERGHQMNVCSAGLETTTGKKAHPFARAVAKQHGFSLEDHLTALLTRELVYQVDLILVMEFAHRYKLLQTYPEAKGKVFQLGHFNEMLFTEIQDPYGGAQEDFEVCYQKLCQSCDKLVQRLDRAE